MAQLHLRPRELAAGLAVAGAMVAVVGLTPSSATASSNGALGVSIRDACDPKTFDAAVGPGTCVKDGGVTFGDFIATLQAQGSHPKWVFKPGSAALKTGRSVVAQNVGGETHTFTEVANFGGGCVPPVNEAIGNPTPVPECAGFPNPVSPGDPAILATFVPAGHTHEVKKLAPGVHKFECLIHPWMRTTVTVGD